MSLILGIDPGASGAFALYDSASRLLVDIEDMPIWTLTTAKSKRSRVDSVALAEMFDNYRFLGVELCVIERVGGRTGQSASAAYVFGYGVGLLYMAATMCKLPIETVPPGNWKALMGVPGKQKADDSAILQRADEMFPHNRELFRGPQGGKKIDRAEAAMLARFGAEHMLPKLQQGERGDAEHELAYHYGSAK